MNSFECLHSDKQNDSCRWSWWLFNCLNIAAAGPVLLNWVHLLNTISTVVFSIKIFRLCGKFMGKLRQFLKTWGLGEWSQGHRKLSSDVRFSDSIQSFSFQRLIYGSLQSHLFEKQPAECILIVIWFSNNKHSIDTALVRLVDQLLLILIYIDNIMWLVLFASRHSKNGQVYPGLLSPLL